ncbi:MAG: transferrin-binding protein-like solute binding protein [Burkholderiales bacterium]
MRMQIAAALLFASLAACHGGGDSTSGPTFGQTGVPFTSFSAVQANQTVNMQGMSTTVTGTLSGSTVSTISAFATDTTATTGKLTYDGARALSAVTVTPPAGAITFSRGTNDTFNCVSGTCGLTNSAGTAAMVMMEPISLPAPNNWNYQTFGVWNRSNSATSFDAGVFSFGAATPASAVPSVGTATFTGLANGFFASSAGSAFFTSASMTANANFGTASITFSTINTQTVPIAGGSTAFRPDLNLTGTFNYLSGSNLFSGPVSATGLAGTATGRFYGPAAQEIGGVYNLSGTAGSMMGSFGGKQ